MNQFLSNLTTEEINSFYHELNIGKRIKLIRQKLNSLNEKDYSLTAMADKIDVHASTLSRFESQNTNLKLTSFIELTHYLDCSLDLALKGRVIYQNSKFSHETIKKLKSLADYNQRIKYLKDKFDSNDTQLNNLQITPSTFNKIINKKVTPKIRTIILIADLFEINIDLLIKGYFPNNHLQPLTDYKDNLNKLIDIFPTQISVLKGMLLKYNYQEEIKNKFINIIDHLIEILTELPHQLRLKELLIHDFQTKLNKIEKIYKPINSIINSLDKIVKVFSTSIDFNNNTITLLSQVENKLHELKLTVDGLNFHQKNKPTGSQKSLTIFTTIAKPLTKISKQLTKLESIITSKKKRTTQESSLDLCKDKNEFNLNSQAKNEINTKEQYPNFSPNSNEANAITQNINKHKLKTNFHSINLKSKYNPDLNHIYKELINQLHKFKSDLHEYSTNLQTSTKIKKSHEYWQLYDLLQLELEIFWNKELILKNVPPDINKELKFLILKLTNFINPLSRLLKILNGEITHQEYYTNYLLKILQEELSNLSITPDLVAPDLLNQIEKKTREFINII
ncbi:helix-turn-helix domain-containing protein [Selenihalanaerobacter shriftii]|uniref:Helix-turn-helix n=1 Tax=Selenihalanaerobacter shriftii TaxID=142842 RepID=A0A1T4LG67_9FIRM|nr:helix-turn-helix transcriptional regulator [Selenihalanaerobacter shriftii]SJZ53715.1 Helix-turn-helix [Selenihalanaerobacter shriftii]